MAQNPENINALQFATKIAQEAGDILMSYFGTELTKKIKTGPDDFATEADVDAEKHLITAIQKQFPEDSIIAEESGRLGQANAEYTWIIDPLDGTRNFTENNQNFAVMIARGGRDTTELAVIYNPAEKILATATKGFGAFLNNKKVALLESVEFNNRPMAVQTEYQEKVKAIGPSISRRSAAANALCVLAADCRAYVGRLGFVWDYASPALLFAEAGLRVTNFTGEEYLWNVPQRGLVAALPRLHEKLLSVLKEE